MSAARRPLIFLSCGTGNIRRMRVLIVEDEPKMAALVRRGLVEEGHAADVAAKGEDAVWMAQAHPYDAIVLDVMLPGLSGFETCRQLRDAGVWTPVLMLTARDAVDDRVGGLDSGADDYVTKPFSFAELLARLRALARRGGSGRPTALAFAAAMAVVLAGAGSFVYLRVGADLNAALDEQLRSRAQDVSALVRRDGSLEATAGPLIEPGESFAELLTADGRVLEST